MTSSAHAVTARVVETLARGYEIVLESHAARREFVLEKPPAQVLEILRAAGRRSRKQLFTDRLGKHPSVIPMGKRFWPLTTQERIAVEDLVATQKVRKLVTGLASRHDNAPVKLVDAAYWVKGCSSLGLWRCAAIVEVGGSKKRGKEEGGDGEALKLALIDIKERRISSIAVSTRSASPRSWRSRKRSCLSTSPAIERAGGIHGEWTSSRSLCRSPSPRSRRAWPRSSASLRPLFSRVLVSPVATCSTRSSPRR